MSPAAGVAQFLRLKQRFFTAAQLFLRALALGGVHHRSNKLELTRLISFSMSHNVDMFDRTIRHNQAIFMLKVLSILRRTLDGLSHQGHVFRMDPLENKFDVGYRRSVVLEDSKGFLGPDDLAGRDSPAETPRMTNPLGFRQVRLALAERLLGPLTFGPLCGFTQRTQHRRHKPR